MSAYCIGLDAGGSKTELLAGSRPDEGGLTLFGPSANPKRGGHGKAVQALVSLVREAMAQRPGVPVAAICAGIAGAGRPEDQEAISRDMREALGPDAPDHLIIVHDARIALEAAFEGGSGIMVIAGTGSVALAQTDDGSLHRVGGWGYLLGDEGSGHAIGLAGLRAITDALDGGPQTMMQPLLTERLGIETPSDLIRNVYDEHWPVQKMAPLVIEAATRGDEPAQQIVHEEARLLARQVAWLASSCSGVQPRVALMGGLTQNAYYREELTRALGETLPGWDVQNPLHRPVVGAWRLAAGAAGAPDAAGTAGAAGDEGAAGAAGDA
jgi:N-acetylglucosamine kinase-like BadF-type ATPase